MYSSLARDSWRSGLLALLCNTTLMAGTRRRSRDGWRKCTVSAICKGSLTLINKVEADSLFYLPTNLEFITFYGVKKKNPIDLF